MTVNETTLKMYQQYAGIMQFVQLYQESALCKLGARLWTIESNGTGPNGLHKLPLCMEVTEASNSLCPPQTHQLTCVLAPGCVAAHSEASNPQQPPRGKHASKAAKLAEHKRQQTKQFEGVDQDRSGDYLLQLLQSSSWKTQKHHLLPDSEMQLSIGYQLQGHMDQQVMQQSTNTTKKNVQAKPVRSHVQARGPPKGQVAR